MTDISTVTLGDYGEFRLLREIVLPAARQDAAAQGIGDDCYYYRLGDKTLAVTADAGPMPLVCRLPEVGTDYRIIGWYAVLATASDIATAGARPLFLVNCIEAPRDLPVAALKEFVDGYNAACQAFGFVNAGGDLREGAVFGCRVTGVGLAQPHSHPGRFGYKLGDRIVAIGPSGRFISLYLIAQAQGLAALDDEQREYLLRPWPQIGVMQVMSAAGVIGAASDASDGLLGAVENLTQRGGGGAYLLCDDALLGPDIRKAAEIARVDPWNLFFFWGDWQVIVTVPQDRFADFERIAGEQNAPYVLLGNIVENSGLSARVRGKNIAVNAVRNENFASVGFNRAMKSHLDYMLHTPIFVQEP